MTDLSTPMTPAAAQRTAEWFAARCGKFTASRFADVLARNKKTGDPLKAYHDLIWQVVVERLSGQAVEGALGQALAWGTEVEPYARAEYELVTGNTVIETGLIQHPVFPFAAASPDGCIGDDGILELKAPKSSAIHLQRFIEGVPDEYRSQVQGQLWCSGRQWADFCSYDPRMPPSHRLLKIRVNRDDAYIATLQAAVLEAEATACELLERLKRIAP